MVSLEDCALVKWDRDDDDQVVEEGLLVVGCDPPRDEDCGSADEVHRNQILEAMPQMIGDQIELWRIGASQALEVSAAGSFFSKRAVPVDDGDYHALLVVRRGLGGFSDDKDIQADHGEDEVLGERTLREEHALQRVQWHSNPVLTFVLQVFP